MTRGKLFIISAPSGGGKGTLVKRILETLPNIRFSISYTTRSPREGEQNGTHYHFISNDAFVALIAKNEFLEHANVHGNFYGTSRNQVDALLVKGFDVILEIDVQGARQVRESTPDAIAVFIVPPSFEELSKRLKQRGTETEQTLAVRLANAREEVSAFSEFDYVVINDQIDQAVMELSAVIIAERCKTNRQTAPLQGILSSFDDLIEGR